jgi:hypothetical protein
MARSKSCQGTVDLFLAQIGGATIGVGLGELWIDCDGAVEVQNRALMVAFQLIENAATGVGHRVVRLKLYGAGVVGERAVLVLQALIDGAAVEIENRVVGIELERAVEVGESRVGFAHVLIDKAAIGVDRREARVELDGAIEIGKRSLKATSDAEGHATVGIGNGLLARIELAALDQIGASHDGIVGGAAGAGLEVVGARSFAAQQQQGRGKDDAGHAVPPLMARRRD